MANKRQSDAGKRDLPERPSQLVGRDVTGPMALREDVVRRLRIHDPHVGEPVRFTEDEFEVLRQIATETNVAAPDPWVRRHAIFHLGDEPTAANLDTLALVARSSPDVDARGEALMAMGRSGAAVGAPILAEALGASDPLEAEAAGRAVRELAARAGRSAVLQAVSIAPPKSSRRLRDFLETVPEPRVGRRPRQTRGDIHRGSEE